MHTPVAPNVHTPHSGESPTLSQEPLRSMNREFQIRFTAGLLILLTTAAVVLAWINFQKERDFQIPSDGVWWVEQAGQRAAWLLNGWNRMDPETRQASGLAIVLPPSTSAK